MYFQNKVHAMYEVTPRAVGKMERFIIYNLFLWLVS